jgi:hypothetical protein
MIVWLSGQSNVQLFKGAGNVSPSLGGEGRDEGGRISPSNRLRTCLAGRMTRKVPVFDHFSLQEGKKPGF